jgi:hypothetical protein
VQRDGGGGGGLGEFQETSVKGPSFHCGQSSMSINTVRPAFQRLREVWN